MQANTGLYAGFYPYGSNTLFVVERANSDTLSDNETLVHELTHALQDQRFHGAIWSFLHSWDEMFAREYIVEGEANYVSQNYYYGQRGWPLTFHPWPLTSFRDALVNSGMIDPECYVLPLMHRYYQGPYMIDRFKSAGGWAAIDSFQYYPPASTEKCLHDSLFFARADFTDYNLNTSFSGVSDSLFCADCLGELHVATLFSSRGFANFESIAAGWNGDMFWIFMDTTADRNSLYWTTAWDTPGDAQEFFTAYRSLLPMKRKGSVISDSSAGLSYTFRDTLTGRISYLKMESQDVFVLENINPAGRDTNLAQLKSSKSGTRTAKQRALPRKFKWSRPYETSLTGEARRSIGLQNWISVPR
jgi:hypothetical protein